MNIKFKAIIKKFIKRIENIYPSSKLKRIEFICFILIYLTLHLLILNVGLTVDRSKVDSMNGILSQIQAFISIYMAFRFSYLWLFILVPFTLYETVRLAFLFLNTSSFGLIIGITVKLFTTISSWIVAVLSKRQELQKSKLQYLAVTDELTETFNQRFFHSTLETEIESAANNHYSLGLIMLDIDNFKTFNDIYGHNCGDEILRTTAALLKKLLSDNEILCRCGGDEFAIILPGKNIEATQKTALFVQHKFEELKNSHYKDRNYKKATISMGLSEYPNMSSTKYELVSQADMALYQ
jgi:diguanylate cyclase (GGDEF)-like protein